MKSSFKKTPNIINSGYLEHLDISNFFLGPFEFEITRFHCISISKMNLKSKLVVLLHMAYLCVKFYRSLTLLQDPVFEGIHIGSPMFCDVIWCLSNELWVFYPFYHIFTTTYLFLLTLFFEGRDVRIHNKKK
jgi:hypothetical protein